MISYKVEIGVTSKDRNIMVNHNIDECIENLISECPRESIDDSSIVDSVKQDAMELGE